MSPQYLQMMAMQQGMQGPQGMQGGPQQSLTGMPMNYQGPQIVSQQPQQFGAGMPPQAPPPMGAAGTQQPQSTGQMLLGMAGNNPAQSLANNVAQYRQNQLAAQTPANPNVFSAAQLGQHQGMQTGLLSMLRQYTGI